MLQSTLYSHGHSIDDLSLNHPLWTATSSTGDVK